MHLPNMEEVFYFLAYKSCFISCYHDLHLWEINCGKWRSFGEADFNEQTLSSLLFVKPDIDVFLKSSGILSKHFIFAQVIQTCWFQLNIYEVLQLDFHKAVTNNVLEAAVMVSWGD